MSPPAIDSEPRASGRVPLRVAHVVATAGRTGVESYLIALLASFDRREVEPTLFVPGLGPLVDALRARQIQVEFGAPTRKLAFGEARALARRWTGAFDLIHAHGPRAAFWAAPAARWAGIDALVLSIHELRWQTLAPGPKRWLWTWLEERGFGQARRLITVSDATRRDLIARRPELAPLTRVVHGSAPLLLGASAAGSRRGARPAGPLRLVTVGRLSWQKGYDILFEALEQLGLRGVEWTLDLVGEGALEPALREQARRLGIADRIHWRGGKFDPQELFAQMDVFVTATRAEMFGIAVLEAMALGLPVLAPAVGSLVEVVDDGVTGRLIPVTPGPTLVLGLAEVLVEWERDPEARARFGVAGAERARRLFSPERLARGVTDVYREVMLKTPVHRTG